MISPRNAVVDQALMVPMQALPLGSQELPVPADPRPPPHLGVARLRG